MRGQLKLLLSFILALSLSSCSTFVVRPSDDGGGGGGDQDVDKALAVALIGAWLLWKEFGAAPVTPEIVPPHLASESEVQK